MARTLGRIALRRTRVRAGRCTVPYMSTSRSYPSALDRGDHSQMGDVGAHIDRHLIATLRDAAMLIEVSNTAQASVELARIAELQRRYHAARAAFNARVDAYPMGYGS